MKNLFKIIGIFIFFLLVTFNVKAEEIIDVIDTNIILPSEKNVFILSSEEFVYNEGDSIYYFSPSSKFIISKGELIKATKYDNYLLIITPSKIIHFDLLKGEKKEVSLDIVINDFVIHDDFLYLVGVLDDDAYIKKYNLELNLIKEFKICGESFESARKIVVSNNYLFVYIYRDALSANSSLVNVGMLGDKKSVIIKLNLELLPEGAFYLNEETSDEKISSLVENVNGISLILNTQEKSFLYDLDMNLNLINYFEIDKNLILLPTLKDEFNYLGILNNKLINFNISSINYIYEAEDINSYLIKDGYFYFTIKNKLYKLFQYEYANASPFVTNYFSDINNPNLKISSNFFIPDLEIVDNISDSDFGKYKVHYYDKVVPFVNIEMEKIILPYTNFVNEGIYKKGKVLKFNGSARLNQEPVYNGKVLDIPGEYDIIIKDLNGNAFCYHIYIVDDYYKIIDYPNISSDIEVNPKEDIIIEIPGFSDSEEILEINMIGATYKDYYIGGDILYIKIPPLEDKIKSIYIDNIIFKSINGINKINVNKNLVIKEKIVEPSFSYEETLELDKVIINLNITDPDKTFLYLSCNDDIIYDNCNKSYNEKSLNIDICFEIDGEVIKKNILELDEEKNFNIDYIFNYKEGHIDKIIITINSHDEESFTKLMVGKRNVGVFYSDLENENINKIILKISISIVVVSIVIISVCLIINKKRKLKK